MRGVNRTTIGGASPSMITARLRQLEHANRHRQRTATGHGDRQRSRGTLLRTPFRAGMKAERLIPAILHGSCGVTRPGLHPELSRKRYWGVGSLSRALTQPRAAANRRLRTGATVRSAPA